MGAWLHGLLGIASSVLTQWAPYANLLDALPDLLRGPDNGDAELVLVCSTRVCGVSVCIWAIERRERKREREKERARARGRAREGKRERERDRFLRDGEDKTLRERYR